jgi:probable phosphoglycerate mutase
MQDSGRIRILHFVRHGQYADAPGVFGGVLSPLGRRQATVLGKHFSNMPIQKIWSSDMNRAIETADIIASFLPSVPIERSDLFREMVPSKVKQFKVPLARRREDRRRLDDIQERLLIRSNTLRHELVVAHGNLIRALLVQVLRAPLTSWVQLDINHCSITTLRVMFNQQIRLVRYNECGHIPAALVSNENLI